MSAADIDTSADKWDPKLPCLVLSVCSGGAIAFTITTTAQQQHQEARLRGTRSLFDADLADPSLRTNVTGVLSPDATPEQVQEYVNAEVRKIFAQADSLAPGGEGFSRLQGLLDAVQKGCKMNIVLALDMSTSIEYYDSLNFDRVIEAAVNFVKGLQPAIASKDIRIGLVGFAGAGAEYIDISSNAAVNIQTITRKLKAMNTEYPLFPGGTNYAAAFDLVTQQFNRIASAPGKVLLFVSDGGPNDLKAAEDGMNELMRTHPDSNTIAVPVAFTDPSALAFLQQIFQKVVAAVGFTQVNSILTNISNDLCPPATLAPSNMPTFAPTPLDLPETDQGFDYKSLLPLLLLLLCCCWCALPRKQQQKAKQPVEPKPNLAERFDGAVPSNFGGRYLQPGSFWTSAAVIYEDRKYKDGTEAMYHDRKKHQQAAEQAKQDREAAQRAGIVLLLLR